MYITNVALHQVPYTIKIVVKSCRVLPTMLLAVTFQGVKYSYQQTGAAFVLVLGLGLFLAGDSAGTASKQPFGTVGLLMLIFSVLLDAITVNVEEKCFFRTAPAATRTEVITYVSSFASLYCVLPLVYSGVTLPTDAIKLLLLAPSVHKKITSFRVSFSAAGEWVSVLKHSAAIPQDTWLTIVVSAAAGYGAMSFTLMLIEHCGVATAEIVKNLRKILQVCTLVHGRAQDVQPADNRVLKSSHGQQILCAATANF